MDSYCIWGTGKIAQSLIITIEEYTNIYKLLGDNLTGKLEYFIDSNKDKYTQKLYDKEIKSPQMYFDDNDYLCVVATTLSRDEIYKELDKNNKIYGEDYISCEQFEEKLKTEVFKQKNKIIQNLEINISKNNFDDLCSKISKSIDKIDDYIFKYIVFSYIIDIWEKDTEKLQNLGIIRKYFDDALIVGACQWYYANNIENISGWFLNLPITKYKSDKPTIGLIVHDYYGGGIEKVVSLLIPMYINNDHDVVLITDSYNPTQEYELPSQVTRIVMKNKFNSNYYRRMQELCDVIYRYDIDIMCFHSGYTYISTFYEMLCIRMQGIPVVIELHSYFLPIIRGKLEVSRNYQYMYKIANKVVVLSETDRIFWSSLECDCVYIQNPIEKIAVPRINESRTHNIIWVGRLVQIPKRVLDVIPIMQIVIKEVPDAKLFIRGLATDKKTYAELRRSIVKNGLRDSIIIDGYYTNVLDVYSNADVVLMTSESESFCNVIIESKMSGIPLVMYKLPWLELLKNKKGYICVNQGDIYQAAHACIKILKDDAMYTKLKEEAIESIEEFIKYDVYGEWNKLFANISCRNSDCNSEFSIIEKQLLKLIYKY